MLFSLLSLVATASAGLVPAPTNIHINLQPEQQLAAPGDDIRLGWAIPPSFGGTQHSFHLRLSDPGTSRVFECQPPVNCTHSDNILVRELTGAPLKPATTFTASVRIVSEDGTVGGWSHQLRRAGALAIQRLFCTRARIFAAFERARA